MRSVPYSEVEQGVASIAGIDPTSVLAHEKTLLANYITDATKYCWDYYPWPEFTITEERFFRDDFIPSNLYSAGSEVYHNGAYYRARVENSDATIDITNANWYQIGDLDGAPEWNKFGCYLVGAKIRYEEKLYICYKNPLEPYPTSNTTNTEPCCQDINGINPSDQNFFEEITAINFDRYIAYSQSGKSVIGTTLAITLKDPRYNDTKPLDFREDREGIYIEPVEDNFASVFIRYREEAPTFTNQSTTEPVPKFLVPAIKNFAYKSWLIGDGQHEKGITQDAYGLDLLVRELNKLDNQQDRAQPFTITSNPYRRINSRQKFLAPATDERIGASVSGTTEISMSVESFAEGFDQVVFAIVDGDPIISIDVFGRDIVGKGVIDSYVSIKSKVKARNSVVQRRAFVDVYLFTGTRFRDSPKGTIKAIKVSEISCPPIGNYFGGDFAPGMLLNTSFNNLNTSFSENRFIVNNGSSPTRPISDGATFAIHASNPNYPSFNEYRNDSLWKYYKASVTPAFSQYSNFTLQWGVYTQITPEEDKTLRDANGPWIFNHMSNPVTQTESGWLSYMESRGLLIEEIDPITFWYDDEVKVLRGRDALVTGEASPAIEVSCEDVTGKNVIVFGSVSSSLLIGNIIHGKNIVGIGRSSPTIQVTNSIKGINGIVFGSPSVQISVSTTTSGKDIVIKRITDSALGFVVTASTQAFNGVKFGNITSQIAITASTSQNSIKHRSVVGPEITYKITNDSGFKLSLHGRFLDSNQYDNYISRFEVKGFATNTNSFDDVMYGRIAIGDMFNNGSLFSSVTTDDFENKQILGVTAPAWDTLNHDTENASPYKDVIMISEDPIPMSVVQKDNVASGPTQNVQVHLVAWMRDPSILTNKRVEAEGFHNDYTPNTGGVASFVGKYDATRYTTGGYQDANGRYRDHIVEIRYRLLIKSPIDNSLMFANEQDLNYDGTYFSITNFYGVAEGNPFQDFNTSTGQFFDSFYGWNAQGNTPWTLLAGSNHNNAFIQEVVWYHEQANTNNAPLSRVVKVPSYGDRDVIDLMYHDGTSSTISYVGGSMYNGSVRYGFETHMSGTGNMSHLSTFGDIFRVVNGDPNGTDINNISTIGGNDRRYRPNNGKAITESLPLTMNIVPEVLAHVFPATFTKDADYSYLDLDTSSGTTFSQMDIITIEPTLEESGQKKMVSSHTLLNPGGVIGRLEVSFEASVEPVNLSLTSELSPHQLIPLDQALSTYPDQTEANTLYIESSPSGKRRLINYIYQKMGIERAVATHLDVAENRASNIGDTFVTSESGNIFERTTSLDVPMRSGEGIQIALQPYTNSTYTGHPLMSGIMDGTIQDQNFFGYNANFYTLHQTEVDIGFVLRTEWNQQQVAGRSWVNGVGTDLGIPNEQVRAQELLDPGQIKVKVWQGDSYGENYNLMNPVNDIIMHQNTTSGFFARSHTHSKNSAYGTTPNYQGFTTTTQLSSNGKYKLIQDQDGSVITPYYSDSQPSSHNIMLTDFSSAFTEITGVAKLNGFFGYQPEPGEAIVRLRLRRGHFYRIFFEIENPEVRFELFMGQGTGSGQLIGQMTDANPRVPIFAPSLTGALKS